MFHNDVPQITAKDLQVMQQYVDGCDPDCGESDCEDCQVTRHLGRALAAVKYCYGMWA